MEEMLKYVEEYTGLNRRNELQHITASYLNGCQGLFPGGKAALA